MLSILLRLCWRPIIKRLRAAGCSKDSTNEILSALNLPQVGVPDMENPPPPPERPITMLSVEEKFRDAIWGADDEPIAERAPADHIADHIAFIESRGRGLEQDIKETTKRLNDLIAFREYGIESMKKKIARLEESRRYNDSIISALRNAS